VFKIIVHQKGDRMDSYFQQIIFAIIMLLIIAQSMARILRIHKQLNNKLKKIASRIWKTFWDNTIGAITKRFKKLKWYYKLLIIGQIIIILYIYAISHN